MPETNDDYRGLRMPADEMRALGYRAVDILCDYFERLEEISPVALADRPQMDALFQESIPTKGEPALDVLNRVTGQLAAHTDHLAHPKFYSFVPSPNNFVSTVADFIATGFNVFSGGWAASPAAAEIEIVTLNWLLEIFGFPPKAGGGLFTSGGSMANLTALATARKVKLENRVESAVIYMSEEAHSSNRKAARLLGFLDDQIRVVACNDQFEMAPEALLEAVREDNAQGRRPFCVLATAGTTNTGSVDPLDEIADLCDARGLWMHVDAAYGGAAILTEEGREVLHGINRAHSITFDPHKWLFQPYEIGGVLVRDHRWLSETFQEIPPYLRTLTGSAEEINFKDYGLQLTRRFRALKFYMSLKTFGLDRFRDAVQHGLDLAREAAQLLVDSDTWELLAGPQLGVVVFRYNPANRALDDAELDACNERISDHVMSTGEAMLATTICRGHVALRLCLINPRTTIEHIRETLRVAGEADGV